MGQPLDNEIIHKEIDLIQSCITRMAHNSFLIKGWCITIVAVVLALAEKAMNPWLLSAILLIPILSFWSLDVFFLRTEEMYRKMYEWALRQRHAGNDESLYDLNPHRFKKEARSRFSTAFSQTLFLFYGVPTVIALCIIAFTCCPLSKKEIADDKTQTHVLEIKMTEPAASLLNAELIKASAPASHIENEEQPHSSTDIITSGAKAQ